MPIPLLPQGTTDFTGISREDLLVRLQNLFNQVNPEWDDFSPAFPENLLLEGTVFIADIVRGVMEERFRQLYWATVTDRLAAIRLGRLSGFTLPGAEPATLTGTFSTADGNPAATSVTIPEGTVVSTREGGTVKKYRVIEDTPLPQNEVSTTAALEQAEVVTETYESSLEPNIELLLDTAPYIDGSIEVVAGNGEFTQVQTFNGVDSTSRAMVVLIDSESKAHVRFGNGINGVVPQGTISVTYKVGGGVAGEVSAGAVWTIEDSLVDDLGQSVTLKLTNSSSSAPGVDAMTVNEAKVRGPQSVSTRDTLSNEDDFETAAVGVSGIARAFLATSDTSSVIAEDTARLELVAFGTELSSGRFAAAEPTEEQLQQVRQVIVKNSDTPPVMGFNITVVAATLRTIDITARIHKASNVVASDVAADIRAALADLFAVSLDDRTPNLQVDFGARLLGADGNPDYLIPWSSVFNAVLDVVGVRYISPAANDVLLNGLRGSIRLQPREFPTLGTITIFDDDESGAQI